MPKSSTLKKNSICKLIDHFASKKSLEVFRSKEETQLPSKSFISGGQCFDGASKERTCLTKGDLEVVEFLLLPSEAAVKSAKEFYQLSVGDQVDFKGCLESVPDRGVTECPGKIAGSGALQHRCKQRYVEHR